MPECTKMWGQFADMIVNNAPTYFANEKAYWLRNNVNEAIASPILLSVPHAGRDYPEYISQNSRLPRYALQKLEDRYADQLVTSALDVGYCAIIARAPRAWVDLNRDPSDIDLTNIAALPKETRKHILTQQKVMPYAIKANAGLGLIPTRLAGYGDIWRSQWHWDDVKNRIVGTHDAYHQALSDHLDARHDIFGCAVLMDVHSMPSLPRNRSVNQSPPQIVLGNRHGASADLALMDALESVVKSHGLIAGHNNPYAGGYVLHRHADALRNVQAVQIEFDRALYLDGHGEPTKEIAQIQTLLREMASVTHDYASSCYKVQAAE